MSLYDPDFVVSDTKSSRRAASAAPHRGNILGNLRAEAQTGSFSIAQILPFPDRNPLPATESAIAIPAPAQSFYRAALKRAFDILAVLASAPLWLPLIAVASVLIALRDGHAPFYVQDRVGRGGRVFRMLKLRSMVPNADEKLEAYLASDPEARAEWDATQKLKNDPRITAIGKFIRKSSIDELPQLVNVLMGDMSIVGPRPFMVNQQQLYHGHRYYDMRPGLTGFWQISDRNECNFAQRVHFDNAYHRALSLKTDLTVIFRTVSVVLRGTGY